MFELLKVGCKLSYYYVIGFDSRWKNLFQYFYFLKDKLFYLNESINLINLTHFKRILKLILIRQYEHVQILFVSVQAIAIFELNTLFDRESSFIIPGFS